MRQITIDSIKAFNENKPFKKQNTEVTIYNEKACLWLHGNCIATRVEGILRVSACSWLTNTTKERLNGLEGVYIYQKNLIWYLNGKEWCGELITIDTND